MERDQLGSGGGLDLESALARVGGDLDLLKEISRVFLDDCPRSLAEIRDAAARVDYVVVERAAHGLKGASSNFGASRVVSAALYIEQLGRGQKLDEFAPAFDALEAALAALCSELEALLDS